MGDHMTRIIFTLGILLGTQAFAMDALPDGLYEGKGSMILANGTQMAYTATIKFAKNEMTAEYHIGPMQYAYKANAEFEKNGYLSLSKEGKKIGGGYCRDNMCHFDITEEQAEETLFFNGTELHRIGSKIEGGGKLTYTEKLSKRR
jgi:hypothetical protein